MKERGVDMEDELIDLNKEPIERIRKRIKISVDDVNEEKSNCVPEVSGRVLRSRTVGASGGEKQVIEREIEIGDGDKDEDGGECEVLVSRKTKKKKGRRGRPPKAEGKCGVSSSNLRKKYDKVVTDGKEEVIETDDDIVEVIGVIEVPISVNERKRKRGRPPKAEGKCGVSSSSFRKNDDKGITDKKVMKRKVVEMRDENVREVPVSLKRKKIKGRRGRPPKAETSCGVSSMSLRKKDDKLMKQKKFDESTNGTSRAMQQVKPRRGRPPKIENKNSETLVKKKRVKDKNDVDHERIGNGGAVKRLKPNTEAKGQEMRAREQKQLLKDQIISMLMKAGWTIEYKQRLSRDYQDAVYVDREGRGYWSVTLAYKKLKERIDKGKGSDVDIAAFSPIPEETLGLLFRITEKGKKKLKKEKHTGKITKKAAKKESSKGKSVDRKVKGKRRTLLARKPMDGPDGVGYELYEGTRSLLSWMIDLGTVPLGGKVKYKKGKNKRIMLEGRITKDGICCDCCNKSHAIGDFESHANSTPGKPYQNIYLDSGTPLFQCLLDSWKKHVEIDSIGFVQVDVDGDDPNDDTCNICGDGGDLICCDSCPSTFHHGCLHIKIPSGDWHCIYCSCKFCGVAGESTSMADDNGNLLFTELFTCCLCEEKFHSSCLKEEDADDFEPINPSFCGNECLKIFERLQALIGVRHELEEGFFYTVLKHHDVSSDASLSVDSSAVERNSKLAVAFAVMDECFEPIIDERSGTNMIHNVVYNCGSNIRRLNYEGFFTIILEKGDDLVSAASIRIHGSQLAEMPFIGTRYMYRRQGMCSRLLTATETVLGSLGVGTLVIPAISELNETWTKVFGFSLLGESVRQQMKYMSMVVFPGVNMLQKPVLPHQLINQQMDSAATECKQEKPTSHSSPSSDFETQTADPIDASATELIEVEPDQNTEIEKNEDVGSLDAPVFDASPPELESHNHDKVDGVELGPGASMPVESLNKASSDTISSIVNLGESSDTGNCLHEPGIMIDNDSFNEAKTKTDCKLEAQKSSEESNTCLNGSLSAIGKEKCEA